MGGKKGGRGGEFSSKTKRKKGSKGEEGGFTENHLYTCTVFREKEEEE